MVRLPLSLVREAAFAMRNSVSLNVTVTSEMAETIRAKVASGAYEFESEVIREGLRALEARDAVIEEWLQTEGVARYDAYHRHASNPSPLDEVFSRVREHHEVRVKSV